MRVYSYARIFVHMNVRVGGRMCVCGCGYVSPLGRVGYIQYLEGERAWNPGVTARGLENYQQYVPGFPIQLLYHMPVYSKCITSYLGLCIRLIW